MLTPKAKISHLDARRDVIIPGNLKTTLTFCIEHLINAYHSSVEDHGAFYLCLSGGSTPKALFRMLTASPYKEQIDWGKIHLFWGDERSVGPDHPESNYHMAMTEGFSGMPIPSHQIHRMRAEENIEFNAQAYEEMLSKVLNGRALDYIMLGMGEDGHTASLFPGSHALSEEHKSVVANWVPSKNTWRMTLTYPCINSARHIVIYVMGESKQSMLLKVLTDQLHFLDLPVTKIGTKQHKALWICDEDASKQIQGLLK